MNNEKFGKLMYFLTKHAASHSFSDFLKSLDISDEEYEEIKKHLQDTYGIKLYV